jgi:hypothetical protein
VELSGADPLYPHESFCSTMAGTSQRSNSPLMKAAVYTRYGPPDVVQIEDVEKPVPRDNEVLIRVRAASVNLPDVGTMKGGGRMVTGLRKPKITRLGVDVAGQVEAVGRNFGVGQQNLTTCCARLGSIFAVAFQAGLGLSHWGHVPSVDLGSNQGSQPRILLIGRP